MKLSKVFGIVLSLHVGVILLVMFQPSCQTTGGGSKVSENGSPDAPQPEESFNQAVEGVDEPLDEEGTEPGNLADEYTAPKRPQAGELIVPKESSSVNEVTPGLIVPREAKVLPLDLKPADLAIYKVVRGDTLWGIARKNNVSLAALLNANPNLDKSGRLSIGQEIMIPAVSSSNASNLTVKSTVGNSQSSTSGNTYTVAKGDTLSRIARSLNVRLSELLRENGMSMSSIIKPGQVLVVPGGSNSPSTGSSSEIDATPRVVPSGATTHTVAKGENLSRIASIYGVSVAQIMEWNGLSNPSLIRAGQPLIVSQGQSSNGIESNALKVENKVEKVPAEEAGSLEDFFNDTSNEDRPIIDAP